MKNIIHATVAFVLAVVSAFATFLGPEDVYVRVKLATDPDGATHCINTEVQCDAAGTQICTVIVATANGNQVATTASATFRPFKASNCVVQLTSNDGGGTSSISGIERLVAQGQP